MAVNFPHLQIGSEIRIQSKFHGADNMSASVAEIHRPDEVVLRFWSRDKRPITGNKYLIKFIVNRIPFRMEYMALEVFRQLNLFALLFPTRSLLTSNDSVINPSAGTVRLNE